MGARRKRRGYKDGSRSGGIAPPNAKTQKAMERRGDALPPTLPTEPGEGGKVSIAGLTFGLRSGMMHMQRRLKSATPTTYDDMGRAAEFARKMLRGKGRTTRDQLRAAELLLDTCKAADNAARHLDRMETQYGAVAALPQADGGKDKGGDGESGGGVSFSVNILNVAGDKPMTGEHVVIRD